MLRITPIGLRDSNEFVKTLHRHHKPVVGHKFSVAVSDGEKIRGVAIVGRPVARMLDNGSTLEVNRVCTDGAPNACSMLYGAAWRVARELGYQKVITYTLPEEGGASLRAAGWVFVGQRGGGEWTRPSRSRLTDQHPTGIKWLWQISRGLKEAA